MQNTVLTEICLTKKRNLLCNLAHKEALRLSLTEVGSRTVAVRIVGIAVNSGKE